VFARPGYCAVALAISQFFLKKLEPFGTVVDTPIAYYDATSQQHKNYRLDQSGILNTFYIEDEHDNNQQSCAGALYS
jgi:hypothetical protein